MKILPDNSSAMLPYRSPWRLLLEMTYPGSAGGEKILLLLHPWQRLPYRFLALFVIVGIVSAFPYTLLGKTSHLYYVERAMGQWASLLLTAAFVCYLMLSDMRSRMLSGQIDEVRMTGLPTESLCANLASVAICPAFWFIACGGWDWFCIPTVYCYFRFMGHYSLTFLAPAAGTACILAAMSLAWLVKRRNLELIPVGIVIGGFARQTVRNYLFGNIGNRSLRLAYWSEEIVIGIILALAILILCCLMAQEIYLRTRSMASAMTGLILLVMIAIVLHAAYQNAACFLFLETQYSIFLTIFYAAVCSAMGIWTYNLLEFLWHWGGVKRFYVPALLVCLSFAVLLFACIRIEYAHEILSREILERPVLWKLAYETGYQDARCLIIPLLDIPFVIVAVSVLSRALHKNATALEEQWE